MIIDPILEHCDPGLILNAWYAYARKLIHRGHASRSEIARLNRIAMIYSTRTGKPVTLSGR